MPGPWRGVASLVGSLMLLAPGTAGASTLADWLSAVDESRLQSTLEELTGVVPVSPLGETVSLVSRNIFHPAIDDAAAYVAQRFTEAGLVVESFPFSCSGVDDLEDLIAVLPGPAAQAPLVVTAHYDSVASHSDGWTAMTDPAPGADDDGSGVALLVELGRILAGEPLGRPVWLVAFSCEEYDLGGSTAWAEALVADGSPLHALASFDPVGFNAWTGTGVGPFLWFSYDDASRDLALRWATRIGESVPGYEPQAVHEDDIGGDARSDHHPFQERGFVALHAGGFPQPETYHTVDDTVKVVDYAYMAAFTRAALALVWDEAGVLESGDDDTVSDDDSGDDSGDPGGGGPDGTGSGGACEGCVVVGSTARGAGGTAAAGALGLAAGAGIRRKRVRRGSNRRPGTPDTSPRT